MITLRNITLTRDHKTVFDRFDLHIETGERLVIRGESGSGKTTLLRLIAGFIAPGKGEIIMERKTVTRDSSILVPPDRRNVSMLFQDLALWPHLDVKGNIEFGMRIRKMDRTEREAKVKSLLKMVGLEQYEARRIDTLSGGEQQRIALARALALSPKVLLMDEPLSSLDSERNRMLRKEIVRLQETLGFTLVYVTHNREEAREIATREVEIKS